jgi:hypothetical protein
MWRLLFCEKEIRGIEKRVLKCVLEGICDWVSFYLCFQLEVLLFDVVVILVVLFELLGTGN